MEKLPELHQSLTESLQSSTARKAHATRCAKILLGCYRTGDANDPEVYVTSVVAILCGYPPQVMETVCSPRTGLPSRLKWLPSLAEIREACEHIHAPIVRMERFEREWQTRAEAQFAARETDRNSRLSYEQLRAKYDGPNGEPWGIAVEGQSSREQARKILIEKYGQAKFDAVPDATSR